MRRGARIALWLGAALLALLLLVLLFAWWLLRSESGRDFALARAKTALQSLGVEYDSIEGTLSGPLTLRQARMDIGGTRISADTLSMDLAPTALLSRRLVIESLSGSDIDVRLAAAEETPAAAPAQPFALPQLPTLSLPFAVEFRDVALQGIDVYAAPSVGADAAGGVSAGDPGNGSGAEAPMLRIGRLAIDGTLSREGRLSLDELAVDSDRGSLRGTATALFDGGRTASADLTVTGPAPGAPPARLVLESGADGVSATVALPDDQRLALELTDTRWRLDSQLVRFDPAPWHPGWTHGPVTLVVEGAGSLPQGGDGPAGLSGELRGEVSIAGETLRIAPSTIAVGPAGESLRFSPLVLTRVVGGVDAGTLRAEGTLGIAGDADADLRVALDDVQLPGQPDARVSGELAVQGTLAAHTLAFDGTLVHPDAILPLRLSASGDGESLAISDLALLQDGRAVLRAEGDLRWTPALAAQFDVTLDRFDPGRLLADWPGQLSGQAAVGLGTSENGSLTAEATLDGIRGTLRGQAVRADGRVAWGGERATSDLTLALGDGRIAVRGEAGAALDLDIALTRFDLASIWPDAAGTLTGSVALSGSREAPRLAIDLAGRELLFAGQSAAVLRARGTLGTDAAAPFDLAVDAEDLALGGIRFANASVDADGTAASHTLTLSLAGPQVGLDATLAGGRDGSDWRGTLESLRVAPAEGDPWTLQDPAGLAYVAGALSLERSCLAAGGQSLCVAASSSDGTQRATVSLADVPLAALEPLLNRDEPLPVSLAGTIGGEATLLRTADGALTVDARLALPAGSVALIAAERRELLAWNDLVIALDIAGERLTARIEGVLEQQGRIVAQLQGGLPWQSGPAPIDGRVQLSLPRLRVLELATPHIADPDGRLEADLALSGTWQDPRLAGEIAVRELSGELPALGIVLEASSLSARPSADGTLALSGRLDTGDNALQLDGTLRMEPDGLVVEATVGGDRVLVSDTPLARVVVSPALELRYTAERGLHVDGAVTIPEAHLDLEQLESSVSPHPDVVVVDPREEDTDNDALRVRAEVALTLGNAVTLEGFGFDGKISGTVTVRERPGRVTTARGTLDVTGEYTAYGQDLEIVQGRLLYSGTPLDNPALDVRAEREIGEQAVGLRIRGSAATPELEIFAEPPLEQAEALSYLVLGRPLNAATSAESGQLSQAAAAIGGNFLAERLGARLGFDTFEVGNSDDLGATAFTVGKYLSPRLYVSYGVALFEEGSILTLRYILTEQFELELESGAENRAGIQYTIER